MKKYTLITISIFFITTLNIFYFSKNKIEPFTLTNQKIILEVSMTDKWKEQLDSIDRLIYSKINLQPKFENLPFTLRIGDTKENVIKKISALNVKISEQKKYERGRNIIKIVSTVKSIKNFDPYGESKFDRYNFFPVETILTFNFNELVSIDQLYFVPEQLETNYIADIQSRKYNYTYLKSKKYAETSINILLDEFLKTFKSKYGEENYSINQKYESYENGLYKNLIHYDYKKLWLKKGVLISFNKETTAAEYLYYRMSQNNLNLKNIPLPFALIKYCSIKQYFGNKKDNQIFMDSIFNDMKKEDRKIKADSIENVKSTGL
jgi:hypothetical protein